MVTVISQEARGPKFDHSYLKMFFLLSGIMRLVKKGYDMVDYLILCFCVAIKKIRIPSLVIYG